MGRHVTEVFHVPILTEEVLDYLGCVEGGTFVDATVGEGGHTLAIVQSSEKVAVIGFDRDQTILERAWRRLKGYRDRVTLVHENFVNVPHQLTSRGIHTVNGVLMDLGISSYHLRQSRRGFSFQYDGPLDMRMDQRQQFTASDVVNGYSARKLTDVLEKYGEEPWGRKIATAIVRQREIRAIETTHELAAVVTSAIPRRHHPRTIHPATKTFMALRIEVNQELTMLENALEKIPYTLAPSGRLCVISFHSLEDRVVKDTFREMEKDCICPPGLPACACGGGHQVLRRITKKPVRPAPGEARINLQARSAKLRVAERA
jgi:16S rRNA (cytosine1402-N4)-methyltransferase